MSVIFLTGGRSFIGLRNSSKVLRFIVFSGRINNHCGEGLGVG